MFVILGGYGKASLCYALIQSLCFDSRVNNISAILDGCVGFFLLTFFLNESDLIKKQISLYLLSFLIFVVFSQDIFGMPYSKKYDYFSASLDQVKHILYLFVGVFFYLSRNLAKLPSFAVKSIRQIGLLDVVLSIPIFLFFTYYFSEKGIRLSGEFSDYAGVRSVWVDYMYVYTMVCLISLRGSYVVALGGALLAMAHLLAAERMRAFVYIMSYLIIYYQLEDKKNQSSLILFGGFFLATYIGTLRHGEGFVNDGYNVTHFGSVSVSSLYLLDEAQSFILFDKLRFFLGSILANIVPSSLLGVDFNIRLYLVSEQDVPGGGWLPVWSYAIAGWAGVVALAASVAMFYRWVKVSFEGVGKTSHDFAKYTMVVIFISTMPRWFMYTPYQVFKMPLYGYVGTFVLLSLISSMKRRRKVG